MIDLLPYLADLNSTGRGWEDSYWHNDSCQSVHFEYSTDTRLKLWIDSPDPSEREVNVGGRFVLVREDDDAERDTDVMLITDDWQAIVALVGETNATIKHWQDHGKEWYGWDGKKHR